MSRTLVFLYGTAVYALFLGTFLYVAGFMLDLPLPRTIDNAISSSVPVAAAINLGLLSIFAIQHTIMARPRFKRWFTQIIPAAAERSTFVFITCLILLTMCWQWRSIPTVIWELESPALRGLVYGIAGLGWATVLYSTFLIDHFSLFGVSQVVRNLRGTKAPPATFTARSLYRLVRHPLMVGFIIAFWAAPTMTAGHLLFAITTTAYCFIGTMIEERDLVAELGDSYLAYRRRTGRFVPRPSRPVAATSSVDAQQQTV